MKQIRLTIYEIDKTLPSSIYATYIDLFKVPNLDIPTVVEMLWTAHAYTSVYAALVNEVSHELHVKALSVINKTSGALYCVGGKVYILRKDEIFCLPNMEAIDVDPVWVGENFSNKLPIKELKIGEATLNIFKGHPPKEGVSFVTQDVEKAMLADMADALEGEIYKQVTEEIKAGKATKPKSTGQFHTALLKELAKIDVSPGGSHLQHETKIFGVGKKKKQKPV
jgi:hypothetical protein